MFFKGAPKFFSSRTPEFLKTDLAKRLVLKYPSNRATFLAMLGTSKQMKATRRSII